MELEIAATKRIPLTERQAEQAKRHREVSVYRESAQVVDELSRREVS